jgi:hypothetical protein
VSVGLAVCGWRDVVGIISRVEVPSVVAMMHSVRPEDAIVSTGITEGHWIGDPYTVVLRPGDDAAASRRRYEPA